MSSGKNTNYLLKVVTVFTSLYLSVSAGGNTFNAPVSQCILACPGDVLTYNCTVVGGIATVWRGTAFDCPATTNDEIILRHSRFSTAEGTFGSCSGGIIRGRSLGVEDSTCYISQVNVTVNSGHNGQTVECTIDPSLTVVGSATIRTAPYPPPVNVSLTRANSTSLSFSWDPVSPSCSQIFYNISSTNCGLCPQSTSSTSATCSIMEKLSSEATTCSFTLQSVACDNIASANGDTATAILKVPDAPEVMIIPIYDSSGRLTGLDVGITEIPFDIADEVDGSSLFYKVTLQSSDRECASLNTSASTCRSDIINCSIQVPSSACPRSKDISVAIAGTNVLGKGNSNRRVVDGVNRFVTVLYNSSAPSLTCQFLDQTNVDKSCYVVYGPCRQKLDSRAGDRAMTNATILSLVLNITDTASDFCYQLTASNATHSVIVNGTFADFEATSGTLPTSVIIIIIVIAVVLVIVPLFSMVIFITVCTRRKIVVSDTHEMSLLKTITYKTVDKGRFTVLHVESDSELRDFVEKQKGLPYKRGCAFFEFVNDFEGISGDKEVILQNNATGKLYTGANLKCDVGGPGERIKRPSTKGYTIFVQSLGSGARHVKPGTDVLYESLQNHVQRQDVRFVEGNHLSVVPIEKACSLREYFSNTFGKTAPLKDQKVLFLNVKVVNKDDDMYDALLIDKDNKFYVGPGAIRYAEDCLSKRQQDAHNMPCIAGLNISDVFVLCKNLRGEIKLEAKTTVIHQNVADHFEVSENVFHSFAVKQHCATLSKVLCDNLPNQEVDVRKAFYEFTREEEDLYNDTEVLLYNKTSKKIGSGQCMLYSIPGAPGFGPGVKNPQKKNYKVFVQCTGSGHRFLKKGASVLYKK